MLQKREKKRVSNTKIRRNRAEEETEQKKKMQEQQLGVSLETLFLMTIVIITILLFLIGYDTRYGGTFFHRTPKGLKPRYAKTVNSKGNPKFRH